MTKDRCFDGFYGLEGTISRERYIIYVNQNSKIFRDAIILW